MGPARGATRVLEFVSRSGRIATDQKAVRRRGPGRVVLGSKPQLATTKKLVRWAGEQAAACDCQNNSCAGPGSQLKPAACDYIENSLRVEREACAAGEGG